MVVRMADRQLSLDFRPRVRGQRYNRTKGQQGGDHKSKYQNDTLMDTAAVLANQYGVSTPTIKRDGQFDIARDCQIEQAGGVFCHACLSGRIDRSPDPRYCQRCFDFLTEEAKLLTGGRKPKWVAEAPRSPENQRLQAQRRGHNSEEYISRAQKQAGNMSTPGKRGPKGKSLPLDLIKKLSQDGMSAKEIAQRLNAQGIAKVSYKTVERKLAWAP